MRQSTNENQEIIQMNHLGDDIGDKVYKNPWTSISRPMNRFMDIDES